MRRKLNFGVLAIFLMLWGVCIYTVLANRDALTLFVEFEQGAVPDAVAMIELERGAFEIASNAMAFIVYGNAGYMKNVQAGVNDITRVGEKHYRREQLKGPNEAKDAAQLLDKIKTWNSYLSRLVGLKQKGVSLERLLSMEAQSHPLFDNLIDHVQAYRNKHMKIMATTGSRVLDKHRDIVKQAKIIGIVGTLLALTIVLWLDRMLNRYIAERRLTERRWRQRRDDLYTALSIAEHAVIFTDVEGRVFNMNPEAERLTRAKIDEKNPPLLSELLTLSDSKSKQPIADPIDHLLEEERSAAPASSFILKAGDDTEQLVTCRGSALVSDDSGERGAVLALRDVTDEFSGMQALIESEARLQLVVFSTYQLIYDWDFKTNQFEWFGDVEGVLGYIPNTFVKWEESLHPNDRKQVMDAYQKVLFEKTSSFDMKYRIKGKDGAWHTWIDRGGVMLDEKNEPYKWVGACTDITEYKWAEKTLRERQYYFRLLIDNMDEAILVIGPDYRVTFVNDRLLERIGRKREEILGKRCSKVLYGHDDPCPKHGKACKLQEVFATGTAGRCSHEIKRQDGSMAWKDILFSPLTDENGKVVRVIEAVRDVTDLLSLRGGRQGY
jgi:PAS domain S-box-containing protein